MLRKWHGACLCSPSLFFPTSSFYLLYFYSLLLRKTKKPLPHFSSTSSSISLLSQKFYRLRETPLISLFSFSLLLLNFLSTSHRFLYLVAVMITRVERPLAVTTGNLPRQRLIAAVKGKVYTSWLLE